MWIELTFVLFDKQSHMTKWREEIRLFNLKNCLNIYTVMNRDDVLFTALEYSTRGSYDTAFYVKDSYDMIAKFLIEEGI